MQIPTADVEPCIAGVSGRSYAARPKPDARYPGILLDPSDIDHRTCPPGLVIPCNEALGLFRGVQT